MKNKTFPMSFSGQDDSKRSKERKEKEKEKEKEAFAFQNGVRTVLTVSIILN